MASQFYIALQLIHNLVRLSIVNAEKHFQLDTNLKINMPNSERQEISLV